MKVHITVSDDRGATFEGRAELVRVSKSAKASRAMTNPRAVPHHTGNLSFSLNSRAFMNKYAKNTGGPRKFTLLLAHLAQGKVGKEISSEHITSTWNRMKSVLGGPYNAAYATRAKAQGWIDSPKRSHYVLSDSWSEVMSDE
jgi:hypothetical protein